LRRRIRRDPVRMLGLDPLEFSEQFVEFQIADDGGIQHVVPVIMVMDLPLEFFVSRTE